MKRLVVWGGQVWDRDSGDRLAAKLRTLVAARRGIVSPGLRKLCGAALGEEVLLEVVSEKVPFEVVTGKVPIELVPFEVVPEEQSEPKPRDKVCDD